MPHLLKYDYQQRAMIWNKRLDSSEFAAGVSASLVPSTNDLYVGGSVRAASITYWNMAIMHLDTSHATLDTVALHQINYR